MMIRGIEIKKYKDYKCIMFIPNINYWYEDEEPRYIFIGWIKWGVFIIFGGDDDEQA